MEHWEYSYEYVVSHIFELTEKEEKHFRCILVKVESCWLGQVLWQDCQGELMYSKLILSLSSADKCIKSVYVSIGGGYVSLTCAYLFSPTQFLSMMLFKSWG